MKSIQALCQNDLASVNQYISEQLTSDIGLVEDITDYIISAGGKRLRPILVLLVANAFNISSKQHIKLAAIIECLHTATLLHDDVVDASTQRRGKPTANTHWGNAPSVLVGDFIYSRSFQMLIALDNKQVISITANATSEISEGEVQQLMNAGNVNTTEADYFSTITRKTATLFAAASQSAAVLASQGDTMQQAMYDYGINLGIAFQLIDDALDYLGNAEEMGKNIGDDLAEGKMTLPLIYAFNNADSADAEVIKTCIERKDSSAINDIIDVVTRSNGIDYTISSANEYADKARHNIAPLPDSDYKKALLRLTEIAVERRS
ncbi:MAG: polyprenyl synthetase family protein [Pseudomonadota bacterium]